MTTKIWTIYPYFVCGQRTYTTIVDFNNIGQFFINYSKQFYSHLKANMKYTGKEKIITKVNYPPDGLIKIKFFHSMEELTS